MAYRYEQLIIERPLTAEALEDAKLHNPTMIVIDEYDDGCTLTEIHAQEFMDFEKVERHGPSKA